MASIDESLTEILSEIRADIRIIKHDLAEDYTETGNLGSYQT